MQFASVLAFLVLAAFPACAQLGVQTTGGGPPTSVVPGPNFSVGGSTFVIKNGNIGIGTTNPTNPITFISTGFPNQSFQGTTAGGFNIFKASAGPAIVIISSAISAQQGDSVIFIKQLHGSWNDPLFRIIDQNNGNSSPQIRIDAYAPNMEVKNINPALVGGLEVAYEPWAIPKAGDYLQVNGRDAAGSQFDDIARWHRKGNTGAFNGGLGFNALQMFSTGTVLFNDGSDTNYVGFKSSPTVAASIVWTLPNVDAPANTFMPLVSNGGKSLLFSSNISSITVSTLTVTTTMTVQGAVAISTRSKTASYTMTSADRQIFVYASVVNTTVTLPSAALYGPSNGQNVAIFKADASTNAVVIVPAGNDKINANVSTVTLCSQGSSQEFISDGATGWYSRGKLRHCMNLAGQIADPGSTAALISSDTYFSMFYLEEPCDMKDIRIQVGSSATLTNFVTFALYKWEQAEQALYLVMSTGPFATPTVGTVPARNAVPNTHLSEGNYYYSFGANNAADTFARWTLGLNGGVLIGNTAANQLPNIPKTIGMSTLSTTASTRQPAVAIGCYGGAP